MLQFIPPDLLGKVDGVEQRLTRGKGMGASGRLALVAAAVQFGLVVLNSDWLRNTLAGLKPFLPDKLGWVEGFETELLFVASVLAALSVLLVNWHRLWLDESKTAFRYTFWAEPIRRENDEFGAEEPLLSWLQRDLTELLIQRIQCFSLLEDPDRAPPAEKADARNDARKTAVTDRVPESHNSHQRQLRDSVGSERKP